MKLRALDLFCGAGGATRGLQMAGFHVTGVDLHPQPRYCGDAFHQADAMTFPLDGFDFIWASPPCQSYSAAMKHLARPHPKLIDAVRKRLKASGAAWVIENVVGAPLRDPVILCGTMFGLRVYRHRLFESSFPVNLPLACDHSRHAMNPHRGEGRDRIYAEFGRQDPELIWRADMRVDWMNRQETRESIPPAFAKFIGKQAAALLLDPTKSRAQAA